MRARTGALEVSGVPMSLILCRFHFYFPPFPCRLRPGAAGAEPAQGVQAQPRAHRRADRLHAVVRHGAESGLREAEEACAWKYFFGTALIVSRE